MSQRLDQIADVGFLVWCLTIIVLAVFFIYELSR